MLVNEQFETSQAHSHILHPGSRTLFRFWETMRGEKAAPERAGLALTQIRDLVPSLTIIAPHAPTGGFRWRLAGTAVCDLYRRELTGTNALAGWDNFERDVIQRLLEGTVRDLQPFLLRFRMFTDLKQLIGAEMIGMPLKATGGGIHVFGGIFPFRNIQLLEHRAISAIELSGARSIWTEHLPDDRLMKRLDQANPPIIRPFQVIQGGRNS